MTYSIIIFAYRKPGTTPEQFKKHYEESHIPLLREIAGETFPLSHTRRYILRAEGEAEGTTRNATTPASVLMGSQADFDFDATAELIFKDAAEFQKFCMLPPPPFPSFHHRATHENSFPPEHFGLHRYVVKALQGTPANAAKLGANEELFLDLTKTSIAIVGETLVTTKE